MFPFPLKRLERNLEGETHQIKLDYCLLGSRKTFPYFLVEFDSSKNGEDKNKLYIAMRAALRFSSQVFQHKKLDILMGVYLTKELNAMRLIVYRTDNEVRIKLTIYSVLIISFSLSGVSLA